MDYTIHNVSDELDAAIRERVAIERKSFDVVLIDVIRRGLGMVKKAPTGRDISDIFDGTPLEPEVIQALEDQRKIELELWK